jgi:hypothetical protein
MRKAFHNPKNKETHLVRVVIRFDVAAERDPDFARAIIGAAKKAGGKLSLIGSLDGLCVASLSWNDAYLLASDLALLVRNKGLNAVGEAEIRVENDIAQTELSTFFNEWKGH